MNRRSFFGFLKEPPLFFAAIVWALMFAAVGGAIACMALELTGVLPFCLYALAAVALGYSAYLAVRLAPKMKAGVLARAHRHAFTENLISSYGFRTAAFTALGFAVNVAYALFNGAMAIAGRSVWFAVFALYYLLLSGMRLGVLAAGRNAKKKFADDGNALYGANLKIYRGCGIALLPLDVALGAAVTLMVCRQDPIPHSEIAAIASAAYAFYKITLAIVNQLKVRKLDDPALQAVRSIGLTDAAVSVRPANDARERIFGRRCGADAAPERRRGFLRVRSDARVGDLDDRTICATEKKEGNRMNGNRFRYSYSAPDEREREKIERIRAAYRTDERAEKFSRLRRLNARVRHAATGTACALGIAGCLLFGGGMSMTLVGGNWVGGIILSACGILPMLATIPVYNRVLCRLRRKYGPEILRLSEELLGKTGTPADTAQNRGESS